MQIKGIARYSHVLKPSSPKGSDKLKYSIQLLIHKSDPQCSQIQSAIDEAILNGFPQGLPEKFFNCWNDLAINEPENEVLKDYMSLSISTNADRDKPPVVSTDLKPIIDPGTQIDGKIVWVVGGVNTYDQVTKGVKVYLNGTCVTTEAGPLPLEAISSKPTVEQMFKDIVSIPVPTSNPQTPPVPAAPVASTPVYQMTAKAKGASRDQFISEGWTNEQLITEGYLLPPSGITPSFA